MAYATQATAHGAMLNLRIVITLSVIIAGTVLSLNDRAQSAKDDQSTREHHHGYQTWIAKDL